MAPIPFRTLLVHLVVEKIAYGAWMATATIEDPLTAETAAVALPDVHRTPRAAALHVLAEARLRILQGTWRN